MPGLVVVTRPEAQSVPVAAALAAKGYEPLVEPMLEIVELSPDIPDLGRFGALAFSSANAVKAFANLSNDRTLRAYAVGPATAAALRDSGFADVRTGQEDANRLAALIADTYFESKPILYLSARTVAQDLAVLLASSGVAVERLVVYEANAEKSFSPAMREALYACMISGVLFFSRRTARTFGTLIGNSGLELHCRPIIALCLSSEIASEVRTLPWKRIRIADKPTSEALLALLPDPIGDSDG
jgi:uroporphyrinogen-III synthase